MSGGLTDAGSIPAASTSFFWNWLFDIFYALALHTAGPIDPSESDGVIVQCQDKQIAFAPCGQTIDISIRRSNTYDLTTNLGKTLSLVASIQIIKRDQHL